MTSQEGPDRQVYPAQPVTLFREMLILPLRLRAREHRPELQRLFDQMAGHGGWTLPSRNMAFEGPGNVWPAREGGRRLDPALDDLPLENYRLRHAYGEIAYFHPSVQRFLYGFGSGGKRRPIKTLHRRGIDAMRVRMGYPWPGFPGDPAAAEFEMELQVERIALHHVDEPGIVAFIMELASDAKAKLSRFDAEGKSIAGNHVPGMTEVLALKDGLRRLCPPYFTQTDTDTEIAQWEPKFLPVSVNFLGANAPSGTELNGKRGIAMARELAHNGNTMVAPWWHALLAPLIDARAGHGEPLLVQAVDERMATLSFVAVPDFQAIDLPTQIRLCFCDGPEPGFPAHSPFLADFESGHCYDRFLHYGARYLFSSYSMTGLVQTGVAPGSEAGEFDFCLDVLQEHMRRHYLRMMMLAHLQRAGLLAFSDWISSAMHESQTLRDPVYRARIDDLRRAFAEFSQVSWFTNVSTQEQPREMFALLQRHLGNQILHDEVSAELDRARAVLGEIDTERQAEAAVSFNAIALTATLVGLPAALLAGAVQVLGSQQWAKDTFLWATVLSLVFAAIAGPLLARMQTQGRSGQGLGTACGLAALCVLSALVLACAAWGFFG